jgi:hypothetical protein
MTRRSARGAGAGRRDVLRAASGFAQVLGTGAVEDLLRVRVGVNRRHLALDQAELVNEDLHRRREAVGGAAGVADHVVRLRVVGLVVDAEDYRLVFVRRRGADDDLLDGVVLVADSKLAVGEEAGRLDDDVDVGIAPRDRLGVTLGEDANEVAVDAEAAVKRLYGAVETAVVAVVLEKVRVGGDVDQVVNRDDLQIVAVARADGAEDETADTAESVDSDSRSQSGSPLDMPGIPIGWEHLGPRTGARRAQ